MKLYTATTSDNYHLSVWVKDGMVQSVVWIGNGEYTREVPKHSKPVFKIWERELKKRYGGNPLEETPIIEVSVQLQDSGRRITFTGQDFEMFMGAMEVLGITKEDLIDPEGRMADYERVRIYLGIPDKDHDEVWLDTLGGLMIASFQTKEEDQITWPE